MRYFEQDGRQMIDAFQWCLYILWNISILWYCFIIICKFDTWRLSGNIIQCTWIYQLLWNKKPIHSDSWHYKIRTKLISSNVFLHIADKRARSLCLNGIDSSGNNMPSASNYAKLLLGWRNIARTVLINLHANTQFPMLITLQPKPLYPFSMYMGTNYNESRQIYGM